MSLFFWLSGLKRRLSPSANVPSTRSTRRSSRSSQPAAYSVERLESRQLLSASTVGLETLVNTTTAHRQHGSTVAMDADGDYVVTWTSGGGQDGSDYGVYAQRYNAAGVAQGGEFQVNTTTAGYQGSSTVAMDAAGDFVVTWTSDDQDGDRFGVYARRYNAAGVAQGGEFHVNTYTTSNQWMSTVAMDADGDFVVTWTSYGQEGSFNGFGVYAQRYNAAGVAQGGEFHVNTTTVDHESDSTVAMDADGDFVVTWTSGGQEDGSYGVYAQRYNAAGVKQGGEFRVNTTTASAQSDSTVALDADGDFVVTWTSYGQDGSGEGVYAQRYNATGVAQGGEFQVNTTTVDHQNNSTVAMDAAGDFVVTWSSYNQDGSGYGVYTQRYNAAGVAQGGEFRVNTTTANWQRYSTVAMDADGDYVVTWSSYGQEGSFNGWEVYAQRYNESTDTAGPIVAQVFDGGRQIAAGDQLVSVVPALTVVFSENLKVTGGASGANSVTNPANWVLTRNGVDVTSTISGITFGLNATTNKYEALLTFSTSLADGVFQLTARQTIQDLAGNALDGDDNGTPGGDFTQSFSIANIVTAGNEFQVNTTTANSQRTNDTDQGGSMAMDAAGDFVVTWSSAGQDGSVDGVYAQRYNAAGVAQGGEFRVNTTTAGNQKYSTVAMDAAGDFVVTWTSYGQDGDRGGVYAQRYNASGVAQGVEFLVNTTTASRQIYSTVAMDAAGDFVVTWTSYGQDGDGGGVYAQQYNAAGVAQGGEFRVNTYTADNQQFSTAAMDAAGDFVVTWISDGQDGSSWGVYAQRYNAAGVKQGVEFRVNTTIASAQLSSTVAMDAAGDFVVTWISDGQDGSSWGVYAQRYNAAGVKQGVEFRVNTTTVDHQNNSTVAMDAAGDFVVTWSSYGQDASLSDGVYAQRYNAAGVAQGGEFRVNTTTAGNQRYSTVAMDADGDFVVTWSSDGQDGSGYGVYAQRYQTDMSPVLATPTAINLTDTSAADTFSAQTGSLTATDADLPAQTLTYGITDGTDNGDGTISKLGTYGTLTVTVATGAYSYAPNATAINGLLSNDVDNFSVTASDGSLNDTKTLTVNLTDANNPGTSTAVAVPSTTTGNIELVADFDWFNFTALGGSEYTFETTLGTLDDSTLTLYDTNGTSQLAFNDDSGTLASKIVWTAPANGTYYVQVAGFQNNHTGTYTLAVSSVRQAMGTAENDAFTLNYSATSVAITISTNGGPTTSLGTFPLSSPLRLFGLGGTDSVRINGTTGSDVIDVHGSGLLVNGSTLFLVSTESLLLAAGAGDDTYRFDADNALGLISLDEVGGGIDTLDFSLTDTIGITINLANAATQPVNGNLSLNLKSASTFEKAIGGFGNDTLSGNSLANTLTGNAGNDRLTGGSGNDSLAGGLGDDTYVFGTATAAEADTVTEAVSAGTDTLSFSTLTTDVLLSLGTTAIQTVHANRTLKLNSASVFENIAGCSGNDTLGGNSLANVLTGNAGNDRLTGGSGNDSLVGGLGDDTYVFGTATTAEADTVTEAVSAGTDTLSFSTLTTDVLLSVGTTAVQTVHANRTLKLNSASVFENIAGGSGNDTLSGNSLANTLTGNAGNDRLTGGSGNDSLVGGLGDDTYVFGTATTAEADTVTEAASAGTDTLTFSTLTTDVILSLGTTAVQTVHANRTLKLNATNVFENIAGGSGNDTLSGNSLANILVGNAGNDTLNGSGGRDILIGGLGLDTLNGGEDEDILIAGRTTSDALFSNLNRVLAEWVSVNSYATRISNLRAGVGAPAVSLKTKVNVLNDAGEDDSLVGGNGTDWYFRALDDVVTGLVTDEVLDVL